MDHSHPDRPHPDRPSVGVLVCVGVCWCVLGCVGVCWGVLGWGGVGCVGVLGCVGVCWGVLGCVGVCWGVLGCVGVCWGVAVCWCVLLCVGVCCCVLLCVAGPTLRRTPPPPDRPKFRALFSFSHPHFHSFSLSLGIFSCLLFSLRVSSRVFFPLSGGLLVEFWWCFGRSGPQMCAFSLWGCRVEAPGGLKSACSVGAKRGHTVSARKWCSTR